MWNTVLKRRRNRRIERHNSHRYLGHRVMWLKRKLFSSDYSFYILKLQLCLRRNTQRSVLLTSQSNRAISASLMFSIIVRSLAQTRSLCLVCCSDVTKTKQRHFAPAAAATSTYLQYTNLLLQTKHQRTCNVQTYHCTRNINVPAMYKLITAPLA